MAAGGPRNYPLTGIVNFNLKVYNKECPNSLQLVNTQTKGSVKQKSIR